jgi:hypothetical protein
MHGNNFLGGVGLHNRQFKYNQDLILAGRREGRVGRIRGLHIQAKKLLGLSFGTL